jgi:hypothetical protein
VGGWVGGWEKSESKNYIPALKRARLALFPLLLKNKLIELFALGKL